MENIFPPVPADTAVALGAYLSRSGTVSAVSIFLLTWVVNVGSAAMVYWAARTHGRRFFRGRLGQRILRPQALARLETMYRHHGLWGIFLSRFVPAVRAVVPPFAGIAALGPVRALVPTALASAIWYGTLTVLVVALADQIEDVIRLVDGLSLTALAVTAAVVLVLVVVARRRSARRRQETAE